MNRVEAIQRIVWCLLRHADRPGVAAATAATLQEHLGEGHERQMTFTNLLRAAALFANDDDGYFMRYRHTGADADDSLLRQPQPNYLLTFPVPAEPRMRIAYNVFAGLLLKYLYQTHGAVPTQVREGLASLVASRPLPGTNALWAEFKRSDFVSRALGEGLVATLSAIGGIGGVDLTETMADSALLEALLTVLPQFGSKFQSQGGMRLDFYFCSDVESWLGRRKSRCESDESLDGLWRRGWQEDSPTREIAEQIAIRIVRGIDRSQPLPMRTFRTLWTGEGSGRGRKRGERDALPRAPRENAARAKKVDDAVFALLSQLDAKRRDVCALHGWVRSKLETPGTLKFLDNVERGIQDALACRRKAKPAAFDDGGKRLSKLLGKCLDKLVARFEEETTVPSLRKHTVNHNREVRNAIEQTVRLCISTRLAAKLDEDAPISIFDWRVGSLRRVPSDREWALRFLKKRKAAGGKTIVKIQPLGTIQRLTSNEEPASGAPFQCLALDAGGPPAASHSFPSAHRCIVCGSAIDLLAGAKSFLPEAKKRHYETPTREESSSLCSNCAFIAYLSSIYPSSDMSIVEFPADNFLELFALHESLQGVSALVALKYVNRVASLSVLPNRYLLLSHRDGKGRMDGKAQVCLQLREQTHLLKYVDRPMRVQIEGGIPQMWSEVHPHVPVGLSHFKELPRYYETQDSARKGFAYEVVRALQGGQPYKALYVAVKYADDGGHPFERRVFTKNRKAYEAFVSHHGQALAKSLGGDNVTEDIYQDIKEFSDYLFELLHPLVRREVQKSGSSVSGIARKYTDLIQREFGEGMAGKFLYAVCQEADSAERDGDGWVKHNTFTKLYGGSPDTKGKTDEEKARAWEQFRETHAVQMEERLSGARRKHGSQHAIWHKFLREVQARTLALLMLNVRRSS